MFEAALAGRGGEISQYRIAFECLKLGADFNAEQNSLVYSHTRRLLPRHRRNSHHFMHYYPPKMAGIPDEDFEIDQHVVRATYRAHDMMLQSLLHLVGPDTTVVLVSDHGFHSGHLRPEFTPRVPAGITVWHRNQGVILAKGPGIAAGQDLHGARLLDVAPTLLHHFGSPVGDDMEGCVLHVE